MFLGNFNASTTLHPFRGVPTSKLPPIANLHPLQKNPPRVACFGDRRLPKRFYSKQSNNRSMHLRTFILTDPFQTAATAQPSSILTKIQVSKSSSLRDTQKSQLRRLLRSIQRKLVVCANSFAPVKLPHVFQRNSSSPFDSTQHSTEICWSFGSEITTLLW